MIGYKYDRIYDMTYDMIYDAVYDMIYDMIYDMMYDMINDMMYGKSLMINNCMMMNVKMSRLKGFSLRFRF